MSVFTAILICIIISIPFIWTLVSKFYKLKKKSFCSFFKTIFLDELSLHKQPLFWLLIASPVIISVTLWAIISPEYKLEWTAHGYAGLIKYGQLPLTILTLSPILGAFVISAHRSIQTAKQIEETEKKNNIDIYFANKKFIYEQLSYVKTVNGEIIGKPTSLYLSVYKTNGNHSDVKINTIYNLINMELENKDFDSDFLSEMKSTDVYDIINDNNKSQMLKVDIERYVISIDIFLSAIKKIIYLEGDGVDSILDKYVITLDKISETHQYMDLNAPDSDEYAFHYQQLDMIFASFIQEIVDKIYSMLEILYEVFVILNPLDDINKLLPSLEKHRSSIQRIRNDINHVEAC